MHRSPAGAQPGVAPNLVDQGDRSLHGAVEPHGQHRGSEYEKERDDGGLEPGQAAADEIRRPERGLLVRAVPKAIRACQVQGGRAKIPLRLSD